MTALVQVRFGGRITCQVRALRQRTHRHQSVPLLDGLTGLRRLAHVRPPRLVP
jgi:hypothetical protein